MSEHPSVVEMNRYYQARAPWHDDYMSYTSNPDMESLLAPLIADIAPYIVGRDVLEIACGTGNWTQVLAQRAHSVLATDGSADMLTHARTKSYDGNVTLALADAYTLDTVQDTYSAAFAADWWSHIPKSAIPLFLHTLHEKLRPSASVLFLDMTYQDYPEFTAYRYDSEGNGITKRGLPNGEEFDVIKNFPTEQELHAYVAEVAEQVRFLEYPTLHRWLFAYILR
ncbi:MAG: class I SAM-dependent methyltransferase [Pseudomonadota bacterium]|nr:class I SAM-dependent methyltransferase [Pseudomonadota bacterium]